MPNYTMKCKKCKKTKDFMGRHQDRPTKCECGGELFTKIGKTSWYFARMYTGRPESKSL